MTIRILHIVTYMGMGGLESMIMNYYRHIDRNKIQFDFLVHRDFKAYYDEEIYNMGGKIYCIPKLNPFSHKYISSLSSFFDEHKEYKIVHSHIDCMSGVPLKIAKKKGIPVRIAHAHSSNQTKDWKYILKHYFKKNIPYYANVLCACSNSAGNWMFSDKSFFILNNAIDAKNYIYNYEKRKKTRQLLKIPEDAIVIGHVGRFSKPKNHKFIIQVFSEIIKDESESYLLLIGDGDLKNDIEKQVNILGISDRVIFTGIRTDVENLLQAMDVFLFPSLYEGLPVSLIEAQASGLPCVISDNVPLECKQTSLVKQISLSANIKEWSNETINSIHMNDRINTFDKIKKNHFDIYENAKWLEDFYRRLLIK